MRDYLGREVGEPKLDPPDDWFSPNEEWTDEQIAEHWRQDIADYIEEDEYENRMLDADEDELDLDDPFGDAQYEDEEA